MQLPSQFLEYLPESARPLPKQLGVLVTTWRSRALSFARESILLIYSALIDNTLVVVLERLQLDKLLRRTQPWLERGSARLFGNSASHQSWHLFKPRRLVLYFARDALYVAWGRECNNAVMAVTLIQPSFF